MFTVKQDRSHGSALWRDLIKVISILKKRSDTERLFRKSKLGSVVGGEHSGKELFEQHINSYSEHLHMSPLQCYINFTPVVYSLTHTQLNFFPNIPPILFSIAYTDAAETHTWPYTNIRFSPVLCTSHLKYCFITWQLNVLVHKCWSTYFVFCILWLLTYVRGVTKLYICKVYSLSDLQWRELGSDSTKSELPICTLTLLTLRGPSTGCQRPVA